MMQVTCFGHFKHLSVFANKNKKWSWKRSIYSYIYIYSLCDIQCIQKNGAVSMLTRNVFLTIHGHNLHRQQQQLSKSLMRYQQFASRAYCGAAGPVSKMASYKTKALCVLCFEVSRPVITVQREFRARFRNLDSCRCWLCRLCLCKVRNNFVVNFWFRTIFCVYLLYVRRHIILWYMCAVLCCAVLCCAVL